VSTSPSTVVALHAHPDDEAIFTGATLYRLARAGVRVVLVTATAGEAGEPRTALPPGESLAQRRIRELERACELLGIQRLVMLGHHDSGAHQGPYPVGSLGAATPDRVARQVIDVVEQEDAAALLHYDRSGIYRHVDHLRVHQVGARVCRLTGITGYEATVDGDRLHRDRAPGGPRHVLHAAAGEQPVGLPLTEISFAVRARGPALLAKMAAMSAHASQIGPEYLDPAGFDGAYGLEWFVRRGPAGPIEQNLLEQNGLERQPAEQPRMPVGQPVG
jgi:LmbE family N-acetylglucosaminyl deacetylase